MAFGSLRLRISRCVVAGMLSGLTMSACTINPQLRSTLDDLGIKLPPPTPVQPQQPAASASSSTSPPAGAAAVSAAPATVATATAAPAAVQQSTALPSTAATTGWIVGSIGEIPQKIYSLVPSGSPYGHIRIAFRAASGTAGSAIDFSTAQLTPTPIDFEDDKEKSAAFAVQLPPGDYVIDSLRFSGNNDAYGKTCKVTDKLAVPFSVRAGSATYIGSLIASADWDRNKAGLLAASCGYFLVSDRNQRDEPAIRQRFPGMTAPLEVHLLSATSDEARNYFRME